MTSPGTSPHTHNAAERTATQSSAAPNEFCDLCGERNAIELDAYEPTGLWICVECIEHTLQGACHE